jgi:tetratricopeptide (TPR) repeat protein
MLGMCYLQTRDFDRARSAFARMYEVPPDSAASYLFSARMMLRQQFDPLAEEYARKAVALDAKLPLAHALLGDLELAKANNKEAVSEFQKELAVNPANAAVYYKLADAYSRQQKFDEAEHYLQRSIWLDATSTGPFILLGKVLAKKGETQLAVRALQHSLSMDPNNFMAHYLLAQAYRDLGNKEDADREFKAAEQLHAHDPAR